jgi:predicted N-acetyltransferase YhbS
MQIRSEQPSDYQATSEVILQAFGQDNEVRLIEKIRKSDRYIPNLSLVAEIDGVVVAHILFSYVDLVGDVTYKVLSLAPLAVRSTNQKQGIGSALVQEGLARAIASKARNYNDLRYSRSNRGDDIRRSHCSFRARTNSTNWRTWEHLRQTC